MYLKPCPFCGDSQNLQTGDNWGNGDGYVHCPSCGGHMVAVGACDDRETQAIQNWNVRAVEPVLTQLLNHMIIGDTQTAGNLIQEMVNGFGA